MSGGTTLLTEWRRTDLVVIAAVPDSLASLALCALPVVLTDPLRPVLPACNLPAIMADAGRPTSALLRQHSMPVALPSALSSVAPAAPASAPSLVSPTTTSLGLSGYTQLQEIGAGTFGKVWKVRRNEDQAILVWKELKYGSMNEKEKKQLVDEVNILRDLNHKNIVKYHDRIIDRERKTIYIVMEHCSGGDIAGIIAERKKSRVPIEEDFIWQVLGEISSALEQCHKKCNGVILHRDLKPANIFLDNPVTKCVKLGDFGLARTLKNSFDYAQTHVGTPYVSRKRKGHLRMESRLVMVS